MVIDGRLNYPHINYNSGEQLKKPNEAQIAFAAKVKAKSDARTADVESHEAAHAAAAGSYGGGINITFGSDQLGNRVALGGHVPIQMPPKVSFKNLLSDIDKAEKHAEIVAFAAVAPAGLGGNAGKLSAADIAVHSAALKARALAGSARSERLSFESQLEQKGQKPNRSEPLNEGLLAQADNKKESQRKPLNLFA